MLLRACAAIASLAAVACAPDAPAAARAAVRTPDPTPAGATATTAAASTTPDRPTRAPLLSTPAPVREIAVLEKGGAGDTSEYGDPARVGFGAVVRNPSLTEGAGPIVIVFTFRDAAGGVLGEEYGRIPYLGPQESTTAAVHAALPNARVRGVRELTGEVTATAFGWGAPRRGGSLRFSDTAFEGTTHPWRVITVVHNPYAVAAQYARVHVIGRDPQRRIVGGGFAYVDVDVEGATYLVIPYYGQPPATLELFGGIEPR